jgi:hypothetical protein
MDNLNFKSLDGTNGGELVKPFLLEEVKQAIWDCKDFLKY